jgi:hypothetical protein
VSAAGICGIRNNSCNRADRAVARSRGQAGNIYDLADTGECDDYSLRRSV